MKFNQTQRGSNRTTNFEGADAYSLSFKEELYAAVAATALSDTFYESADSRLTRIQELIRVVAARDAHFVAKLAVYARQEMHLRSVPLVLLVELAKVHAGDDLVRRATRQVVQRADEITELLAYYQQANGRTGTKRLHRLSKQLQRGLADAFNRFDEYQFAKYNRDGEVRLRDALFLVHPKAKDEAQQQIFDRIASNTLQTAYTWETELSSTGQQWAAGDEEAKQAAFRERWEILVRSGKVGYMALLRNLRNLLNADVSEEVLEMVAQRIADPEQVKRSRQFPFRFYAAYRELEKVSHTGVAAFLQALDDAMTASAANITGFAPEDHVAIFTDVSGSMHSNLSKRSSMQYYEVGLVLSALFRRTVKLAYTGLFGEDFEMVQVNPNNGVLSNVRRLSQVNVGHSTNGYKAIKHLLENEIITDKVLIFTDCQLWNSNWNSTETIAQYWKKYQKIAPEAKLYLFDLAGYGNTPISTHGSQVKLIAGWSDKVFEMLDAMENGSSAVQEIEEIEI